jgi:hypothetical protein
MVYEALGTVFALERRTRCDLRPCLPTGVLRGRGIPIQTRRRRAMADLVEKNSVTLVKGPGSEWDVLPRARPAAETNHRDQTSRLNAWDEIGRYFAATWYVACEFRQAPSSRNLHSWRTVGSTSTSVSVMRCSSIVATWMRSWQKLVLCSNHVTAHILTTDLSGSAAAAITTPARGLNVVTTPFTLTGLLESIQVQTSAE